MYKAGIDIVRDQSTTTLPSRLIWDYIVSNLEGTELPGRNLSCDTTEYGIISQKEVSQTLEHVFGGKLRRINGIRTITFNPGKLQRFGKVYDFSIKVEVLKEDSSSKKSVPDLTDLTDIETCKGLDSFSNNEEIPDSHEGYEEGDKSPYVCVKSGTNN